MTQPIVLRGHLTPDQQLTYISVPFNVPNDIGRIDVAYSYDAAISSEQGVTGGNTIDIGIFDARGSGFGASGYRGWSGSARSSFYLALDAATEGYLPGPIQAGTWNICLGAYKVAEQGCNFQVEIILIPADGKRVEYPVLLGLSDISNKNVRADGWYKGELHCHTVHSDGDSTVEETVRLAESLGLDFLAIMDHNNQSQRIDMASIETPLMLIPGYEVTTYFGHWNIWGAAGWIDFRIQSPEDMARSIAEAKAQGYLLSCNHPHPYGPDWAFLQVEGFDCVEIWNGPWEKLNTVSLSFWEKRLDEGKHLPAVGGSDNHFTKRQHTARLGHPTTYIYCAEPPSPAAVLRALRAGHAFITDSPDGPRLEFHAGSAMMGDTLSRPDNTLSVRLRVQGGDGGLLQLIGANVLVEAPISSDDVTHDWDVDVTRSQWLRAQLVDPTSKRMRAITNPIYLD